MKSPSQGRLAEEMNEARQRVNPLLDPRVDRQIRSWSAEFGVSQGRVIDELVFFAVSDAHRAAFRAYLETRLSNPLTNL